MSDVEKENDMTSGNKTEMKVDSEVENANKQEESDSNSGSEGSSSEESSSEDEFGIFDSLTAEEKQKMRERMSNIQSGFVSNQQIETNEKISEIRNTINMFCPDMKDTTNIQITFFIDFGVTAEMTVRDICEQIQEDGTLFLEMMIGMHAQSLVAPNSNSNSAQQESDDEVSGSDEEKWQIAADAQKKRKKAKPGRNLDGSVRSGRLLLDDALKDMSKMAGWSGARQKAFAERKTRPNAYYYRFNAPGQPQKNGQLRKDEHITFMKRALEMGVNDQWGIFSKAIPGRVGYQCSNYWRQLVKDRWIVDPNYVFVEKTTKRKDGTESKTEGLKFLRGSHITPEFKKFGFLVKKDPSKTFKGLPARHPNAPNDEEIERIRKLAMETMKGKAKTTDGTKSKKKRKRAKNNNDSDDDYAPTKKARRRARNRNRDGDDDDEFVAHVSLASINRPDDDDNPIPDHIDIMTGCPVEKPAISPYGHVLGYDTWCRILRNAKTKNQCPFTKQRLTRRSLVKLTRANYSEYESKMVNIDENALAISKLD